MKVNVLLLSLVCFTSNRIFGQALYVPGGTGGIGSSSNSNIGIGTAAPSNVQNWDKVLDVYGSGNSKILATSSGSIYRAGIYSHSNWSGGVGGGGFVGTESNHNLHFITNYTPKMTLDTDGRLGIATTTPYALLHINSMVDARKAFRIYWNNDLSKYLNIFQGTGGAAIDPIGTGLLYLGYDQATNVVMNGSLGIGTANPSSKLVIDGVDNYTNGITLQNTSGYKHSITAFFDGVNPTTGSGLQFKVANNSSGGNSAVMTLKGSGNIGIGTDSPSTKLDVRGGIAARSNSGNQISIQSNAWRWDFDVDEGAGNAFRLRDMTTGTIPFAVATNDNIGIGTTTPDAKLAVKGVIHTQEVKIDLQGAVAPDYVFEKDYKLPSLKEIKTYIDQNKHLPEVPSAKEMEANGVNLGEMNMLLLRKIEELTLYAIEQNKKIEMLEKRSVGPDTSGKKVEELTLQLTAQQRQIEELKNVINRLVK